MVTIDENTLTIIETQYLSWDTCVKYIYEHIREEVSYQYKDLVSEGADEGDETMEAMKAFIDYQLTDGDKLGILSDIVENYNTDSQYNDKGLFDETEMTKVICKAIDSEFWTNLYDDYEYFL